MSFYKLSNTSFVYLTLKGVSTNKFGEPKYSASAKSVYSVFPERFCVEFQMNNFKLLVKKYHDLITTASKHSEKIEHLKAFIKELDEGLYGIFIDADTYSDVHMDMFEQKYKKQLVDLISANKGMKFIETNFNAITEYATEINNSMYGVPKVTTAVAAATAAVPVATVQATAVTTAVPDDAASVASSSVKSKTKTKGEKLAEFKEILSQHTADFEPSKWSQQIKDEETKFANYPTEIASLQKEFRETGDFAKKGRAQRLQKELDAFPAKLAILKANLTAKQNYYTDGYQPLYVNYLVNLHILYLDESNGLTMQPQTVKIREVTANKECMIHFARNPAARFELKIRLEARRSAINRLRKNKDEELRKLGEYETELNKILTPNPNTEKYFVKYPEEAPI